MSASTQARRLLAQHIRHFASGLISFAEYERRVDDIPTREWDRAMSELDSRISGVQLDWDFEPDQRYRGHKRLFDEAGRKWIALVVLFLRTDLPYEWSMKEEWYVSPGCERPDWTTRLMVRIGMVPRCPIAEQANHIYPFRRQSDLDEARATCHLLGRRS